MSLPIQLTDYEIKVLEHVYMDVDDWCNHAFTAVGEWAIKESIDTYTADYDAALLEHGSSYKNRVAREADTQAAFMAEVEKSKAELEKKAAAKQDEFNAAVAAAVAAILAKKE